MSSQPQQTPNPQPAQDGTVERRAPLSTGKALLFIAVGLVLAVLLAVLGIVPRLRAQKRLTQQTDANAAPGVLVAKPTRGKPENTLILPGALQAYIASPVYARTSGYLSHWYADIGAHVRQGQLLAVIESPEIDQQLKQSQADLATIEATARNAAIQARRYQDLLAQDAVSKLDTDNFVTQQLSSNTQVKSAQANVDRLQQMVGFERVYAPFTGTITARDIDTGQLINAGAATSQQLFEEAQTGTLRVYIAVPQIDSVGARPGVHAQVSVAEYPGHPFDGRIVRTSGSIDPTTRTLLVEVDVDNRQGKLLPGAYGEVHIQLNTGLQSMVVPVSTMIFQNQGLQVAVVRNGKAYLIPITAGQNDGKTVAVLSGLSPEDEVIQNPPDSILDGEAVRIIQRGQQGGASQQGGGAQPGQGSQGAQGAAGSPAKSGSSNGKGR